jgi:hypothetical protein
LSEDAFAAYTLALAYWLGPEEKRERYAESSAAILNAWASTNRKITGFDGDLTACYCGVPLVLAAELLSGYEGWEEGDREMFRRWLGKSLIKSANTIKRKKNNHGCWGVYVSLACNHFLDRQDAFGEDVRLMEKHIATMIDAKGELPAENKRTNSGMWYTYFALCPLTCGATIATNATGKDYFAVDGEEGKQLKAALDAFFGYCRDPNSWPYEKPGGLEGAIYNTFYPSADTVKMPRPNSWPGNLYEAMLGVYDEEEWERWLGEYRPIQGGRGWIWPSVTKGSQVLRRRGIFP